MVAEVGAKSDGIRKRRSQRNATPDPCIAQYEDMPGRAGSPTACKTRDELLADENAAGEVAVRGELVDLHQIRSLENAPWTGNSDRCPR